MSTTTSRTDRVRSVLDHPCTAHGIDDDLRETLVRAATRDCYDGADTDDVYEAVIGAVTARVDRHPELDAVAAAVARRRHERRVLGAVPDPDERGTAYRESFPAAIERGVRAGLLDERMLTYDLEEMAETIVPGRDERLDYVAVDTLQQRYFLRDGDDPIELPQTFWLRVAMGVALREPIDDRAERAREFYEVLSTLRFVHSTPTLFHAGTTHPQLASCYVTTMPDDLEGIFDGYTEHATLSKWSGGLGNDWTPVRATGARIASTGVESTGVVPFLKISNDVTAAINRSGKRRGAACAYLAAWHADFPDFVDLRRNTGDERRRTHDMNTAAWIPDLFVERVREGGEWTLFSPDEVPDLHECYGAEFRERYEAYEAAADRGELDVFERVDAESLWRELLTRVFETGHPWLTFKDPINVRSPQDHAGTVRSSNLCTEITLNTGPEETAVCNLGSVNLAAHVREDATDRVGDDDPGTVAPGIDRELFADTVATAMRMLDNVVDLNFYPSEKAERSNMRHRPVGLGMMGFHEALLAQDVPMASEDAVEFADEVGELLAYHAVLNSSRLAAERGTYDSYDGSKWDRDLFPQDTVALLEDERGVETPLDPTERLDWERVREHVAAHGMRNSNATAVAPTATISTIAGTTASIEPVYSNLYVKSNMSGDFTVVNDHLVADLRDRDLWDDDMVDRLTYHDGSVQEIDRVPDDLKELYRGAFEIDPRHQIRLTARRGQWIDQSQSHNVFFPSTDGSLLDDIYQTAWEYGLKTTYYLRTLGASQIEKSTLDLEEYDDTQRRNGRREEDEDDQEGEPGSETDAGDVPTVEDPTCDACQ